MNDINIRLKKLRQNKKLSQKQVAEYLGIPQQTYSNYERDVREIPANHVVRLARLYHVRTDSILGMDKSSNDTPKLDAAFMPSLSYDSLLHSLLQLNRHGRKEFIRFLSYLIAKQKNGKK